MRKGDLAIIVILFCVMLLVGCWHHDTGPAQREGEATLITLKEVLRLGDEATGDTILFGPIARIAVNGHGDILVSEIARVSLVRAFGADGTFLSQVGGQGQGPGEYEDYVEGPVIGTEDSVYLWDSWTSRVLIYDPENFSYVQSVHVAEEGLTTIDPLIGAIKDGWYMGIGLPAFLISDDGSLTVNDNRYTELIKVNRDGSYQMGR